MEKNSLLVKRNREAFEEPLVIILTILLLWWFLVVIIADFFELMPI